jgi:hypothetical protein
VLAGCYQAPGAYQPSVPTLDVGASASPAASPSPEPSPDPTATLTPTAAQTPTPIPTHKPTPKPTPTPLPWKDSGSIDVPFEIHAGTTIRFRLWDFSAPATCSLTFTWPDSTVLKLATKTATKVGAPPGSTNAYGIDWKLTIPATQVGEGKFAYVCKYLGKTRLDSWFTILIQAPL